MNDTVQKMMAAGFHKQIEHLAKTVGDQPAFYMMDRWFTYEELNTEANRLAHRIQQMDAPPFIATMIEHPVRVAIAMIALSKAVRTWIPVNTQLPYYNLVRFLHQFDELLIINDSDVKLDDDIPFRVARYDDLVAGDDEIPLVSGEVPPDFIESFQSTSGSTGIPKVIARSHQATVNLTSVNIPPSLLFFGNASLATNNPNIIRALCHQKPVHHFDLNQGTLTDLRHHLQQHRIEALSCAPSTFRVIFADSQPNEFPALKQIRLAGEPILRSDFELFKARFARGVILFNFLGCVEVGLIASLRATHDTVITSDTVPVGKPPPIMMCIRSMNGGNGSSVKKVRFTSARQT